MSFHVALDTPVFAISFTPSDQVDEDAAFNEVDLSDRDEVNGMLSEIAYVAVNTRMDYDKSRVIFTDDAGAEHPLPEGFPCLVTDGTTTKADGTKGIALRLCAVLNAPLCTLGELMDNGLVMQYATKFAAAYGVTMTDIQLWND